MDEPPKQVNMRGATLCTLPLWISGCSVTAFLLLAVSLRVYVHLISGADLSIFKLMLGTCLAVQLLRLCLQMQGVQVRSLVEWLRYQVF